MITCTFEDNGIGKLRHVTVNVILLNKEKNKILLARRSALHGEANKLCLPGGFMGRDEILEQTAIREVLEETGYNMRIHMLFRINDNPRRPNDEERQNIDFVYVGETLDKVDEHDNEIASVEWFDLDSLPSVEEFAFDHFDNIEMYLKYIESPFPTPITSTI